MSKIIEVMWRAQTLAIFIFSLLSGSLGEVVTFGDCNESDQPLCKIHEVNINPCPEALHNKTCKFPKGEAVTIEFDYTPKVDGVVPQSRFYWDNGILDVPYMDMLLDACEFSSCPIVKDQKQHYLYSMTPRSIYLTGKYNLKWKMWNKDEDKTFCCMTLQIEITKKKKKIV